MEQHRIPSNTNIVIDVCGMHGVWFDHREIRAIVGELSNNKRREIGQHRHRYRRIRDRSHFAAFLNEADEWWPWKALEELLDFFEDIFD